MFPPFVVLIQPIWREGNTAELVLRTLKQGRIWYDMLSGPDTVLYSAVVHLPERAVL